MKHHNTHLLRGEDNLAKVLVDARDLGEVDAAVVNAEKLVHHCLVRPLVQQRRDGVVATIDNLLEALR